MLEGSKRLEDIGQNQLDFSVGAAFSRDLAPSTI